MKFGFSYVGLAYQLMMYIPNGIWTRYKPKNYEHYVHNENKCLVAMERVGQVSVSCLSLIFSDLNPHFRRAPLYNKALFGASAGAMILYDAYWIRYFRSPRTMKDFYSSILGIPLAGATLPVMGFFFLSLYGRNLPLLAADMILGVGHIGIHWGHLKEVRADEKEESEKNGE